MKPFAKSLVATASAEWAYFGYSSRAINNTWKVGGEEFNSPYRERVQAYWSAVGHPTWDGKTTQPWSGAFISWCFEAAKAEGRFKGSSKHSVYIDWIRTKQTSPSFTLVDPASATLAPGDLIWNARRDENTSKIPKTHAEAIARLKKGDYFISHVDIVVEVRASECDSIGGNVSNADPGGSVTRSTWHLNNGLIVDPRKTWIGVVKTNI